MKTMQNRSDKLRTAAVQPNAFVPGIPTRIHELLLFLLFTGGMIGCLTTGFSLSVSPAILCIGIPIIGLLLTFGIVSGKHFPLYELFFLLIPGIWGWLRIKTLTEGVLYITAGIYRCLCWGFPGLRMPFFLSEHSQFLNHAESNPLLLTSIRGPQTEVLLYLTVLSGLLWTVLYRKNRSVWISALLPLPALVLCLLIIETTLPSLWALLLILLYWMLLLFTRSAHHLHARAASAQTAFLLIPCTLFLCAVYLWYPQQTPVGELAQNGYNAVINAVSRAENLFVNAADGIFSGSWFTVSAEGNEISFDSLNPRRYLGHTVMRAKSDTTGVVYLREKTYGLYTADGWKQTQPETLLTSDPSAYSDADIQTASAQILAESGVRASRLSLDGARSSLLFAPYYFSDASVRYTYEGTGQILNPDRNPDYDVVFYRFSGDFSDLDYASSAASEAFMNLCVYHSQVEPLYLQIDAELAAELRSILSENNVAIPEFQTEFWFNEQNDFRTLTNYEAMWQTVADITHFVRGAADYSLDADKNTSGREFVLWFLEDAEYGYCTHFATAEVMLLRACGIPARLAVGFLGSIRAADRWTAIKDSNAHAWAEVYDVRLGWIPVEATPPTELSADMNAEDIIVGMMPIPGDDVTESTGTETAPTTETAESQTVHTEEHTAAVTEPDQPQTEPQTDREEPALPPDTGEAPGGSGTSALPHLLKYAGTVLLVLLSAALFAMLLIVYRYVRRKNTAAWLTPTEEERNSSALRLYRQCTALAHECGIKLPCELTVLAEKARFSHHTLTEQELDVIRSWYLQHCRLLQEQDRPLARLRHYWIDMYY